MDGQTGNISRFDGTQIRIDGIIDESVWQQIAPFDRLRVLNPDTLEPGQHETQTRIFYDDNGIYIAALMKQPPETLVERLSARDEDINRDGFSVMLDTSGQGLYGYIFGINLGGTKQDGKLAPESVMSYEWDGAWQGKRSRSLMVGAPSFSYPGQFWPCPNRTLNDVWGSSLLEESHIWMNFGAGRNCHHRARGLFGIPTLRGSEVIA